MEATMTKIDLNNLDKSNWKSFPFEKIASKVSETVDPNKTELTIYVGLEHIDAEDIHIRRFGLPTDVSGGKLKCYPGDVIFGKRRAYQRKAAIVDFEGICSAHAFVFRANPNVIDPKLFPFFLHSDQFMHRMVDISVGGLSPTINWSDLKHQEFLLPPKEEQAKLAELLWAMDDVIEREKEVLERINLNYWSLSKKIFSNNQVQKIEKFADLISGSYGAENGPEMIKVIGVSGIKDEGNLDFNKFNERFFNPKEKEKFKLKEGDLLMVKSSGSSTSILSGRTSIFLEQDADYIVSNFCFRIRPIQKTHTMGIFHAINSVKSQTFLKRLATGSTYPNLGVSDLKLLNIYLPYEIENKKLNDLFEAKKVIDAKIILSQSLQKSLINQVF